MMTIEQAAELAEGLGFFLVQPGPMQRPRRRRSESVAQLLRKVTPEGGFTAAEAFRRALMEQAGGIQTSITGGRHGDSTPRPQVSPLGVRGLPEDDMNLIEQAAGLGELFNGLGIPGPYGDNPSQMLPSGTYEVTGTGVNFRSGPSTASSTIGVFNADTSAGDKVVGTPEKVEFNGETAGGGGLTWAKVKAQGKEGFVAVKYLGPVGYTAQHGGISSGGGGGGITPAKLETSSTTETDYTPYILGGAAVVGIGIIGWALFSKKKGRGRGRHRRRAHA